jgi:hypothetical protein
MIVKHGGIRARMKFTALRRSCRPQDLKFDKAGASGLFELKVMTAACA